MKFCVQYDSATGIIHGTVHANKAPGQMPAGRAQLVFDDSDHIITDGKMVDVKTKKLIDAPQPDKTKQINEKIAALQAQIDDLKSGAS